MAAKKRNTKSTSLRDQILQQLRQSQGPMSSQQITDALGLRKGARVRARLRRLADEGMVKRQGPQNKAEWLLVDEAAAEAAVEASAAPEPPPDTTLTARLVDTMAANIKPWKARDIARALDVDHLAVRAELVELERLGIVYRTGRTRGTRWHLG